MGYGVEKAVLSLISPDLTDQKDRVEDQSGDQDHEKDNTQHQCCDASCIHVDNDPADIQQHGQTYQADTQNDEKRDSPAPTCNVHRQSITAPQSRLIETDAAPPYEATRILLYEAIGINGKPDGYYSIGPAFLRYEMTWGRSYTPAGFGFAGSNFAIWTFFAS